MYALMYADDLVIYFSHDNLTVIQETLQEALNDLGDWSHNSGLKFSESKTTAMLFTRRRKNIYNPDLFLNGT